MSEKDQGATGIEAIVRKTREGWNCRFQKVCCPLTKPDQDPETSISLVEIRLKALKTHRVTQTQRHTLAERESESQSIAMGHYSIAMPVRLNLGNGPNTVSESTVSNTELSEFFGAQRVPGSELSEFLSAYYLCVKANSPSFSQNSPSLPQNSVRLSEFPCPKQYSRNSIPLPFPRIEAIVRKIREGWNCPISKSTPHGRWGQGPDRVRPNLRFRQCVAFFPVLFVPLGNRAPKHFPENADSPPEFRSGGPGRFRVCCVFGCVLRAACQNTGGEMPPPKSKRVCAYNMILRINYELGLQRLRKRKRK